MNKKNFIEEMEKDVGRVKEYIPPIAILITADAGAGKFQLARKLSSGLAIYLLSNDYVRNYFYQLSTDKSEDVGLEIQDKVSEVNNERVEFLISHRISFVYDHNIHNMDCYEEIHKKLHNNSFKIFKIRIHSDDNYNIKAIRERKMDYDKKDKAVIGDNVFYASSFSEDVYWQIKKKKNITLNDDWFDFVINRTDDEEKFKKDILDVVEKIRDYMES